MTLNQEFSESRVVPTGISGDIPSGYELARSASRNALLAQQAYVNELLDRSATGQASEDEERIIARIFLPDQAHGNN